MATDAVEGSPKSGHSNGGSPSLAKRFKQEARGRSPKFGHRKKVPSPKKSPNLASPKTPKKSHSPRWCRSPKLKHQKHVESPSVRRRDYLSPGDIANSYEANLSPTITLNHTALHPPTDSNHNATSDCHHKDATWNNNVAGNDVVLDNLSASTQSLSRPSLFRRFMNWQHSRSARSSQTDLDQLHPSPLSPGDGKSLTPTYTSTEEIRPFPPPAPPHSPRSRGLFANFKRERLVSAVTNTKNKLFNITGLHHRGVKSPANASSEHTPQVSPTSITMATAEGVDGDPEKSRRESVQEWLDNLTDLPHTSSEDLAAAASDVTHHDVIMTSRVEAAGASGKLDHDDLNLGAEAKLMKGESSTESLQVPPVDLAAALALRNASRKRSSHHWEDRFGLFRRESLSVSSSTSDVIWESVDNLLNERTGDPEELLTSLGFLSTAVQEDSIMRVPERFLMNPSTTEGVSVDAFLNVHPDLKEMIMMKRSFQQPTTQADDQPRPSILQPPAETRRTFFDIAFTVSMINRFKNPRKSLEVLYAQEPPPAPTAVHFGLTPTGKRYNSILHPDNSEAHAVAGMYDEVANQPSLPHPEKLRKVVQKLRSFRRADLSSPRISSVDAGDAARAVEEAAREKRTKSIPSLDWDASSQHSTESIPHRFRKTSTFIPKHLLSFSLDGSGDEPQKENPKPTAEKLSIRPETFHHVSTAPELHAVHDLLDSESKLNPVRKMSEAASFVPSSIRSSVSSIAKPEDLIEEQGAFSPKDCRVRFSLSDAGGHATTTTTTTEGTGDRDADQINSVRNDTGKISDPKDQDASSTNPVNQDSRDGSVSGLISLQGSMDFVESSTTFDAYGSVDLIGDEVDDCLVGQEHIEKWLRDLPGTGVGDIRRDSDIRDELLGYEPGSRVLHSSQSVPAMATRESEETGDAHKMRSATIRQDSVADKRRKFSRQSQVSVDNQEHVLASEQCGDLDQTCDVDLDSSNKYCADEPMSFVASDMSNDVIDDNGNVENSTTLIAISSNDEVAKNLNNAHANSNDEAHNSCPDVNLNKPSSLLSCQNTSQSQTTNVRKSQKSSRVLHLIQNLESSIQSENENSPTGNADFSKTSAAPHKSIEKKEDRETQNLQKYAENNTLTAVQSALVSSLSGSKHPPKIVSYMLARRDSCDLEKGQEEELVFKSSADVQDANSDNMENAVRLTVTGPSTDGGSRGSWGESQQEKKQIYAEKSKVECSFELEEVNSEDMVIDTLPSLAVRRNLKGSLVRTGSAQSDSSGFVEADALDAAHPSELDWGRLKVCHLDSSGSDSQGPGHPSTAEDLHAGTSDCSTPGSALIQTQDSLDSLNSRDTTGSDTVILSDPESDLHPGVAGLSSSCDENMGNFIGKGRRSKSEVKGYTADDDLSDSEVWLASTEGDKALSAKKVKKLRKRSKQNGDIDGLESVTSGEEIHAVVADENLRKPKISKINKVDESDLLLFVDKSDIPDVLRTGEAEHSHGDSSSDSDTHEKVTKKAGLNQRNSSGDRESLNSDSPHLVAELYVDPLTPPVSHVSEVVLFLDQGTVKQIAVSDKEEETKQDVMWCVNYGVHELSPEEMSSEHGRKRVSTSSVSSVNSLEQRSHDDQRGPDITEHYKVTAQQGVYHLEQVVGEPTTRPRPHYWSDRISKPPCLADELRMAEDKENLPAFSAENTIIDSDDMTKVPLLATSTPLLSNKPPPKPPRSPMLAHGNVACLHLNVQDSPAGAKYAPRKMSSAEHVCPPMSETVARQHGVLCSLLKHSGAWSPTLEDISSRNAWDFSTSDLSVRSTEEHTQVLLDQATLLRNALAKYKHDFQEIVSQARLLYDSSETTRGEKEKISELFDLGENIMSEVWELERHLAGRIDDLISGRDDQDINNYVLDFSSLNILREVIELLKEQVHHRDVIRSLGAGQNSPDHDDDDDDGDDSVSHEVLAAIARDVPDAPSTKQVLAQLTLIQRDLMEQNNRASMQLNSSIKELRESLLDEVRDVVKQETSEMKVHIRATEYQVAHLRERLTSSHVNKEHLRVDSGIGPECDPAEPSPTGSNGFGNAFEVQEGAHRGSASSRAVAARGNKASSGATDPRERRKSSQKEKIEPQKQSKNDKR